MPAGYLKYRPSSPAKAASPLRGMHAPPIHHHPSQALSCIPYTAPHDLMHYTYSYSQRHAFLVQICTASLIGITDMPSIMHYKYLHLYTAECITHLYIYISNLILTALHSVMHYTFRWKRPDIFHSTYCTYVYM
jgi:hypothetical protein